MIKVIASDLDGTLLNEHHTLSDVTRETIKKAQAKGLRFIIATGRAFKQVEQITTEHGITCDYIVSSGGEVRTPEKEVVYSGHMKLEDCKNAYEVLKNYTVPFVFNTEEGDYCIGTLQSMEDNVLDHIFAFNQSVSREEIKKSSIYKNMVARTKVVPSFTALEELNPKIIKIFIFSKNLSMLGEIEQQLQPNPNIAVASSFSNNLEITDVTAQKGPVLKKYIESLGYTMDEVMVFGDSMNDYSMLSMNFGATIAMENGDEKVKSVAKYVTKSNIEDGVAYAVEKLLEKQY